VHSRTASPSCRRRDEPALFHVAAPQFLGIEGAAAAGLPRHPDAAARKPPDDLLKPPAPPDVSQPETSDRSCCRRILLVVRLLAEVHTSLDSDVATACSTIAGSEDSRPLIGVF
jgi:hypothetical protein